jgi:hypothetical protein
MSEFAAIVRISLSLKIDVHEVNLTIRMLSISRPIYSPSYEINFCRTHKATLSILSQSV